MTNVPKVCITVPESLNIAEGFDTIQTFRTSLEYPSNLPAMIMKDHLNMVLPAGKSPEDVGICFISAEAVASIAKAYKAKAAQFDKILTVIGKKGTQYRVQATIGTPIRKILNQFNIHVNEQDRIVIGGPMKGFAAFTQSSSGSTQYGYDHYPGSRFNP
jgi:electron transport complex protein RnfC